MSIFEYIQLMSRTSIMFLFILVFSTEACFGQNDRTFPNAFGSWSIRVGENDPWLNWYTHDHLVEYVHNPQVALDGRSWGSVWGNGQIGLIAVDSGKVLYRSTAPYEYADVGYYYNDTTTRVLYDFNLLVGDTAYTDLEPITVLQIDTIILWGQGRKHLALSNEDEWIEGVGSVHGLFRPFIPTWGTDAISYTMVDFCGEYVDTDSLPYTMCLPDAITELQRATFSVAPNPTCGSFAIHSDGHMGSFSIRNMSGAIVLNGMITGPETRVERPDLVAGVYYVRMDDRCIKLIVQ